MSDEVECFLCDEGYMAKKKLRDHFRAAHSMLENDARIAAQASIMLNTFKYFGPVPTHGGLYKALCEIESGNDSLSADVPAILLDSIKLATDAENLRNGSRA